MKNRRYYRIAGLTIEVTSDLPMTDSTFSDTLELFRVDGPGVDTITIHQHFGLPDLTSFDLGKEVFRKAPWAIYQQTGGWLYLGILPEAGSQTLHRVVSFNRDYSHADIYNPHKKAFESGNLTSLTLVPSDQLLIAQLLADRQGCYLHSAGAILDGAGLMFVGHSDAGKSTITRMLMGSIDPASLQILCDDRNIVRHQDGGWLVYGTWSHGEVPDVSPSSAPLKAICFIEQAKENSLRRLSDRKEIIRRLLACVIKPFVTAEWWQKTFDVIENIAAEVPCYTMRFDRNGAILTELKKLKSVDISK